MENDVLRNKIAPWQEKGRWYHALFDVTNQSLILSESDKIFSDFTFSISNISGCTYMNFPISDITVIDCKSIYHKENTITTQLNYSYPYRGFTSNSMSFPIGPSGGTGLIDFYIFAVLN